jgi:hypothetical protein
MGRPEVRLDGVNQPIDAGMIILLGKLECLVTQ